MSHGIVLELSVVLRKIAYAQVSGLGRLEAILTFTLLDFPSIITFFFIWFVRQLALRPLLAYCASLG
jgi:hypothetical protein